MTGSNAVTGPERPQVWVITGPVGSGKTTVTQALAEQLGDRPRTLAVDADELRRLSGRDPDDPFWSAVARAGFQGLWRAALDAGARIAVVADVIETEADVEAYRAAAHGADVLVVRLHTPLELIVERLRARMAGDDGLDWHLRRAPELHHIMTGNRIGDLVIEVGDRNPAQVAAAITAKLCRW